MADGSGTGFGVVRLQVESADATRQVAAELAARAQPGDIVLLVGDLGAGKTVFAQGFAAALGVVEPVTSPTFVLVHEYRLLRQSGPLRVLLHADLYRLERLGDVADLGLGELVEDGGVALVEWGDMGASVLGGGALVVSLTAGTGESERLVSVRDPHCAWSARWRELVDALAPWEEPS